MKTLKNLFALLLIHALVLSQLQIVAFARGWVDPVAVSFAAAVPVTAQSVIQLQGSDGDGTALTYATLSSPSHGALSNLNVTTGAVVYTPTAGYTGSDSFTYKVTSGGADSNTATVSLTVTANKTRIIDTLTNPDSSPRVGKVTFILSEVAQGPSGLIAAKSSVSATLNGSGQFDVQVFPSRALSPVQFYQVWFDSGTASQLLGIYDIPAATTNITLTGRRVTNTNLAAQYTFASKAEVDALTVAVAAATTAQLYPSLTAGKYIIWNGTTFANSVITESGGNVTVAGGLSATSVSGNGAGLTNLPAAQLTGTLPNGVFPAVLPATSGQNLTNIAASGLTGTLPVLNGQNLTNLPAAQLTGTLPNATFPATLPAVSGANLTSIQASQLSGTLPALNGQNLTSLSAANLVGSLPAGLMPTSPTFSGTVTAANFVGNGAGITGLTGATGGVSNTGSTTIGADTDSDNVGVIALQTKTVTRLQVATTGITASVPILDAGGAAYNPQAHGAAGDGTADDRGALNTLVNTTMSAGGVVEINKPYRIASNMTFPAGVYLRIHGAGRITPDNGVTVTILGGLPDEARQMFSNANASQGTIDLTGNVAITNVYPEWWGAKPSNSASNNNAPMQAAFIGAFGSNRTNASGDFIYNKRLRFSGMYSISAAINFYHVHGAVLEGVQQMGCGIKQTASNTKILNGQSVTRLEVHQMRFEVSASQGNGYAAIDLDYDGSQGSDLRVQNVRFKDCFLVGNNLGNVGAWIGKTSGSQGDNVSFENCYASGWWAAAVLGGNNTGNLTGSSYNYNALNAVWDKGDIQSCKNGLLAYGGNWIFKNVTVENQSKQTFTGSTTPTTDGVDVYCEAAIRGCKLENVLSESYRLWAGDGDFVIRNVRQQGTPTHWYVAGTFNLAGTTPSVGAMISGTGVGGDGKMYEVTAVSAAFGGLTYTQATSGSATTIVKTSAGWTTNAFTGYRASILTGTGKYLYGVITGNTSDTITVSSWLTKYHDILDTAPDNTSFFVVEPNWGTQTTVGGVTIAQRDYYTVTGLSTSTSSTVDIDGLYLTHLGQIRAQGKIRTVEATRADWFAPHSNVLDDTIVLQSYDNITVREGAAGNTYKPLKWSAPRNRTGYDKYASQLQMGTKSIVFSAGQTGGGTSFQDLVITRGDGIAYNDANAISRNVLGFQGALGRNTPVGTNQAGLDMHVQVGLSTGNASPGKLWLLTGGVGSSGASVNVSDTTNDAYFDRLGFRPKSYTFANLPTSVNGQILYCSDCTPSGTLAGSSTGAFVQRLNGAWSAMGAGGGGGGLSGLTTGNIPYADSSTSLAASPLSRLASYSVAVSGNADTNGPNYTLTDTSSNSNSRNWALMNGAVAYGDFHIRHSNSQGGSASGGTSALVLTRDGAIGIGGVASPAAQFEVAGPAPGGGTEIIRVRDSSTSNWNGLSFFVNVSGVTQIATNYNGTGTELPLALGTYNNRSNQLYLNTAGNVGIGQTTFGTSAAKVLAMANGTAPTTSPANAIQMWSDTGELKVRDASGNVTTLSPHNFTRIPGGPSEPLSWSFYSERDGKYIAVDMTRVIRLLELLTGEKLIFTGTIAK